MDPDQLLHSQMGKSSATTDDMICFLCRVLLPPLFTCGEAVRSMTYDSPSSSSPSPLIYKLGQVGASKDMATYVIEVTDLKSDVRHDL